jgi:hypothetical protein
MWALELKERENCIPPADGRYWHATDTDTNRRSDAMKLEQLIRNVLERAIEDGLVAPMENLDDPDPQSRTEEELRGCVCILRDRLAESQGSPRSPHWSQSSIPTRQ